MLKPMFLSLGLASAIHASAPLDLATLTTKTLPPEVYGRLEKGGGRDSLSWSWKDPSFPGGHGFRVEQTRWIHDERNGFLFAYLRDQLELEARRESPCGLRLTVTYYALDSVGPQWILEGIFLEGGKAKAVFVESVNLDPGDSPGGLVDEFLQDLGAFLK
jgi:hypothetical protein